MKLDGSANRACLISILEAFSPQGTGTNDGSSNTGTSTYKAFHRCVVLADYVLR